MNGIIVDPKTHIKYYAVKAKNLDAYPQFQAHRYVPSACPTSFLYRACETDQLSPPEHEIIYLQEPDFLSYCDTMKLSTDDPQYVSRLEDAYVGAMVLLRQHNIDPSALKLCDKISESIKNLSLTSGLAGIFSKLSKSPEIKKHMVRTLFCRILTSRMGWSNDLHLQKIFMASVLAQIYPNPEDTAKVLENLGLPKEVVMGVLHHQENGDGSGPLKIKRHYIYPLSRIIRVSEELAILVLAKKTPIEIRWALNQMTPSKLDSAIAKIAIALWPSS